MPQHDETLVARVDAALSDFLDARAAVLHGVGEELAPVTDAIRTLVLDGGKRLRPRFAYWGWRAVHDAARDDRALVAAAASLELLHGCALVHDDVMDASGMRRGRLATHAAFAAMHRDRGWPGDPQAFGTATAILVGDLLLAWADTMFAGAGLDPAAISRARHEYDAMRELVMAGQYLDVLVQARGAFSIEDALRVAAYKTSKYTVEGPLRLGAAAAQGTPEVFAALSGYGRAVGEAFQLRDDVLGVFGVPERTGKPAGDDLREGKRTLLVALAMQAASAVEAELLRHELGDRDMDEAGVAAVREVIVSTGALDQVEQRIAQRTAEARAALDTGVVSAEARAALDTLAAVATERTH